MLHIRKNSHISTYLHVSNGQTGQLSDSGSHCWDHEPALVHLSQKITFASPHLSPRRVCCSCLLFILRFYSVDSLLVCLSPPIAEALKWAMKAFFFFYPSKPLVFRSMNVTPETLEIETAAPPLWIRVIWFLVEQLVVIYLLLCVRGVKQQQLGTRDYCFLLIFNISCITYR